MKKHLLFDIAVACLLFFSACGSPVAHNGGGGGSVLAATHFSVTAQSASTAGVPFNFTVNALDASNNVVTSYTGKVSFTSTDGQASLPPPDSTLTNGTAAFQATLNGVGSQTITATDSTASITGTSKSIKVSAAAVATHFSVAAPADAAAGATFMFPVTALDDSDNLVTNYSGVVHFSSNDPDAVLPSDSGISNGARTFAATMNSLGPYQITATDRSTSLTGTSGSINVLPAGTLVIVSGQPPNGAVGQFYSDGLTEICGNFTPIGFELEAAGAGGRRGQHFNWSSSSLPPGLSLHQLSFGTGPPVCPKFTVWVIDGTPTEAGTFTFTVTVSDSVAAASASYTIEVENPLDR